MRPDYLESAPGLAFDSGSATLAPSIQLKGVAPFIASLHAGWLQEEALGKDPAVFFTFDFFMHETQATPIVASNSPSFNTTIQYVVDNDPFLLEYMDTHVLVLELCRARGYDYEVLGMARLPLRQVLEDLEIGAGALGASSGCPGFLNRGGGAGKTPLIRSLQLSCSGVRWMFLLITHMYKRYLGGMNGFMYSLLHLRPRALSAALGYNRAYHYADVFGADGNRMGRVRYGYCFRRPLDSILKEYRLRARTKRASDPDERDPATQAVQQVFVAVGYVRSGTGLIIWCCILVTFLVK